MKVTAAIAMALLLVAGQALARQAPSDPPPIDATQPQDASAPRRPWLGVSVGAGWEKVFTTSGSATNPIPFRFVFRTPLKEGWSIAPMLGWFTTDLDATPLSASRARLGELRVRPILMGARYTWIRGQLSYDVAGAAGFSINSFDLFEGAGRLAGLGSGPVRAEANTSPAWRLQVSSWYDFTERVALRGSLAYAWVEPEITFSAGGSGRRISQSANSVQLGAGIVYRLF